jgi:hypothetical protein
VNHLRGVKLDSRGISVQLNVQYGFLPCARHLDCYLVCNKNNPSFLALFQAKALAEKNMRDLLAQREQAERNVKIF